MTPEELKRRTKVSGLSVIKSLCRTLIFVMLNEVKHLAIEREILRCAQNDKLQACHLGSGTGCSAMIFTLPVRGVTRLLSSMAITLFCGPSGPMRTRI
jgi:hypothetical protein